MFKLNKENLTYLNVYTSWEKKYLKIFLFVGYKFIKNTLGY